MKKINMRKLMPLVALVALAFSSQADVTVGELKTTSSFKRLRANCSPATAAVDLDVNNIRARIMNGGDMWWDLVGTARYEVPKVQDGSSEPSRTSLFAGSVWIGGFYNGSIHAAAMTYRQNGSDFWPGALNEEASIDESGCNYYDRIFEVSRVEIDDHIEKFAEGTVSDIDNNIKDWPGNGRASEKEKFFLAPYENVAGGPEYEPELGDYPLIKGDQALWFVYNDVGNNKRQAGGDPIGLELRTMAFAFATSDEINNMTFYETTIWNIGAKQLDSCFFGQWVDADLGYAYDDYVGCDVERGLGICYNGDNFDEGAFGYGSNPPSIGVDFFQGPKADLEVAEKGDGDGKDNDGDGLIDEIDSTYYDWYLQRELPFPGVYEGDGIDNNRNGLVDEPEEDIIMSKFVYYNNDFNQNGNPNGRNFTHHYNYLRGRWKNGDPIRYGGNGFNNFTGGPTDFMFPDDPRDNNGWSEVTSNNQPADRRFLQSAGPFTLKSGAVNVITVGVVWARATSGGNTGSYDQLLLADDKAQKLFNNSFKLLDGPDAPSLSAVELDQEVILIMNRDEYNITEQYEDQEIATTGNTVYYDFQGYQLYQLANDQVSNDQLNNADLAREVWQSDIKDGVGRIANQEFDPAISEKVSAIKVDGSDDGVSHTIRLTTDVFASGNNTFVNQKAYHYMLLAYASADVNSVNEDRQYLEGRKSFRISVIPRKTEILNGGTRINTEYGDGPKITQLEGVGNGGIFLDLDEESVNNILADGFVDHPTYTNGHGPVNIKVIDPLKLANNEYTLKFIDPKVANTEDKRLTINIGEATTEYNDKKAAVDADAQPSFNDAKNALEVLNTLRDSVEMSDSLTTKYWPSEIQKVNDSIAKVQLLMVSTDSLNELKDLRTILTDSLAKLTNPDTIAIVERERDSVVAIIVEQNAYVKLVDETLLAEIASLNRMIEIYKAAIVLTQKRIDDTAEDIEAQYSAAETKLTNALEKLAEAQDSLDARTAEAEKVIWELTRLPGDNPEDVIRAERPLYIQNEMVIDEWGFSIQVGPVIGPGEGGATNGFLDGTLEYEDPSVEWLTALPDRDGVGTKDRPDPLDWIRSGGNTPNSTAPSDAVFEDVKIDGKNIDDGSDYEGIAGGIIAPYSLVSHSSTAGGYSSFGLAFATGAYNKLDKANFYITPSIDLVFTNDRTKWTRVLTVEMGEDPAKTEGGAKKFMKRRHPGLELEPDADGNPVYSDQAADQGMSWFPGYAIDVETGERLNIIMGENSSLNKPNTRDLIWNPSNELVDDKIPFALDGGMVVGGMHYIYVMHHKSDFVQSLQPGEINATAYDQGKWYASILNDASNTDIKARRVWNSCAWVMPSYLAAGTKLLSWKDGLVPTESKLKVRVNTPYKTHATNVASENANLPYYKFGTSDIAPTIDTEIGKKALQGITIVPNPYYAFSSYESGQVENQVRLTNLPAKCDISIYTVNGQLVKRVNRDINESQNSGTSYKWDLKNDSGVPIASGIYIIHIDGGELGEATVKFFCALRPVDLDSF